MSGDTLALDLRAAGHVCARRQGNRAVATCPVAAGSGARRAGGLKERENVAPCPRCGQLNRPEAVACAVCGTRFAQAGGSPGGGDGLPDWLRQIQSGQQQGAGQTYQSYPQQATGSAAAYPQTAHSPQTPYQQPAQPQAFIAPSQQFSAGSLVSDDALPDWLRSAGQESAVPQQPASWGGAGAGWGAAPAGGVAQGYPAQASAPQGAGYGPAQPTAPQTSGPLTYGQPGNTLFDDAALPEWLRDASRGFGVDPAPRPSAPAQLPPQATPGASPAAAPGAYAAFPPQPAAPAASTAFPSIDQAGQRHAPQPNQSGGLSGNALLDPGALPQWLGGQQTLGAPSAGPANPGGMAAQSLIDESALPQWLRAEPNTSPAPAPTYAAPAVAPAPTVTGRIAASANAEPLPAWLNQVYSDANVARIEQPAVAPAWGAPAAPPVHTPMSAPGGGDISAGTFVDESALPEWLRSQGAMESPAPAASVERLAPQYVPPTGAWDASAAPGASGLLSQEQPAAASPAGQFSASDLIDPSALPSWVSSGQQAEVSPSFSSTTGWTSRQSAVSASDQSPWPAHDSYDSPSAGWGAGEPPSEDGAQAGWPMTQQPQYQFESDQRFSGPLRYDDDGEVERSSFGSPAARRDQPMPVRGGFGGDPYAGQRAPDSGRRRGAPIPHEELPPWLQRGGAVGMQTGQGQAPRGYGAPQYGERGGAFGGQDGDEWGAMPQGGEQWTSWDDGQYAGGAGYDGAYADYPGAEGDRRGRQRGGWRRFFGRK